ncbi:DUF6181 family protein [Streptomyces millisiae]|uniref:DUF6181 family protein n=1 Tax=Streptomyces millisiae TaxID=3075542 RepID=A0ABU2LQJ7_9ACTN|nr:DUF6181 family protein [Streptomyces sp. DSM 44918]MDT0319318.1 DUF6181 family protein [Streptomyces sp. DSM 44918]
MHHPAPEAHRLPEDPARRTPDATRSRDGSHRLTIPLRPRLAAAELTQVLLSSPLPDYDAASPDLIRQAVEGQLLLHGYAALRPVLDIDSEDDRHNAARAAIRRAYGARFHDEESTAFFAAGSLFKLVVGWQGEEQQP